MDNLGAWSEDDLKSSLDTYGGVAYYSDLSHVTQFTHGVAKLLRVRSAHKELDTLDKLSVFILGKCNNYQSERVPRLDSGLIPLEGGIWFVARTSCLRP